MNSRLELLGLLIVIGVAVFGFSMLLGIEPGEIDGVQFKEIPRFDSHAALVSAFEQARAEGRQYGIMNTTMRTLGAPMAMSESAVGAAKDGGSSDFSTTNVQVEGVDEADIVKSDGKYIYNLTRKSLVITDAYPINTAKIASQTKLEEINPIEMFISGDKLLLFGNKYRTYEYEDKRTGAPGIAVESMVDCLGCWGRSSNVLVQLYDISDRSNPVLDKELEFQGNYISSRLIEDDAYFVVTSWPDYRILEGDAEKDIIPLMREDGVEKKVAEATEIGYIAPMPAQNFITISSINLQTAETEKETIVGNAQNVFASQTNIYLAGTIWKPVTDIPIAREASEIIVGDVENTVINKFGLDNGKIGFLGQGSVPGRILNQFSMDEFNSNFRIATTVGWNGYNNLYVLDKEMNTIGSLEDLAPGESIYSARFMGNKAYMVTFKKADPLFVIDVSDPTNPRVLGKLKIPGYSDYLHPIDETHLIGVGKEAIESVKGDFAWYQGLKMAVFDVSDVANPKEMHKIVIGDRGTDSYALRDHKAFLYDKEKDLLVLPIMLAEIPEDYKKPEWNPDWPAYGEPVFQGAFVFKLTLENGFEERGRITHVTEEDELKRGYYFGDDYSVKRSLYIGNVLYTLSNQVLKANSLDNLEELKEFVFE
ncbi:MAG: hypothetical protein CL943_02950 [Candidatus Diapherotrites archaeon]|uniref:Beta-propeller domain-containing protein n=1 Tax=Candidatus Iainarchaeum sp. TaxID=3101447 RepID=A0A2D6M1E9_9ARCH|nr:hypothetical protein [Candidatus Diapherotrites archaeon]|tara:strand:- start:977 stop:2926 length:1950 start_codon:yes stop_codon:yes gene_type:complete